MKNYLNFETEIKNIENEIEKLKDPFNKTLHSTQKPEELLERIILSSFPFVLTRTIELFFTT